MVTSSDRFGQARIKLDRADQHIQNFQVFWEAFLKTEFCTLRLKDHPEGGQLIQVEAMNIMPAEMALIPGDAIHNMRCALDYIIAEILGWREFRLAFPFDEERDRLIDSFRTVPVIRGGKTVKKGRNARIEEALPGFGKFIVDKIRPYRDAGNPLWIINELDRRDKHRLLIPVIIPQTLEGYRAIDDYGNVYGGKATIDAGVVNLAHSRPGTIKIEDYGRISAEIFFNEVGLIEQQPVIPTLTNMREAISEAIKSIEEFVTATG